MRADGRPSGVAVARVMAFDSTTLAASACSNRRLNWRIGSASRSRSSRPASEYSRRRSDTDMVEAPHGGNDVVAAYPSHLRRSRSELAATDSELRLIAAPAQIGPTTPSAAAGTHSRLY